MPRCRLAFSLLSSLLFLVLLARAQNANHAVHDAQRDSMKTEGRWTDNKLGAGTVPLDVEGYELAPEDLHLEQVHVYVRHGA